MVGFRQPYFDQKYFKMSTGKFLVDYRVHNVFYYRLLFSLVLSMDFEYGYFISQLLSMDFEYECLLAKNKYHPNSTRVVPKYQVGVLQHLFSINSKAFVQCL